MVRSIWKKTLITTLAWAAIAWAQQPLSSALPAAKPMPATTAATVVTIHEAGKPPQKCQVVKSWQTTEGAKAYQVQALDTGEMITILESGPAQTVPGSRPGMRKQAMTMRIYHWGKNSTPPAGAPLPPVEIVQTLPPAPEKHELATMPVRPASQTTPRASERHEPVLMTNNPTPQAMPQLSTQATFASGPIPDPASLLVSPVPHKPKEKAKEIPAGPVSSTPSATSESLTAAAPQRSSSSDKPASIPTKSPYATTGSTGAVPSKTVSLPTTLPQKPAGDKADSPYCQTNQGDAKKAITKTASLPTTPPQKPVGDKADSPYCQTDHGDAKKAVTTSPPPSPGVSPYASAPATAQKGITPSTSTTIARSTTGNTAVTAAPPTDWRTSWGDPKTATPAQLDPKAAPPTLLPQANAKLPDPLQAPEKYMKRAPLESKPMPPPLDVVKATDDNLKKTAGWAASSTTESSAPTATTAQEQVVETTVVVPQQEPGLRSKLRNILRPRGETRVACPRCESMNVSKGSEQVTVMEPGQEVPLGAQSVTASGVPANVQYIPVPVVSIPNVQQPPMPPSPYGRMAQALPPANMQTPMAQGAFVMDHSGTMPNPNLSAGYSQGQEPSPQAMQQMLAALRDSLYPSQREWAAESLATVDWRSNPHIVQALVTAAKDDPAATVRAGCVRCLAKMNVNTAPVLSVIEGLKTDADPRVRQEVDIALGMLSPGRTTSTVQPAGAAMPLK